MLQSGPAGLTNTEASFFRPALLFISYPRIIELISDLVFLAQNTRFFFQVHHDSSQLSSRTQAWLFFVSSWAGLLFSTDLKQVCP